MSRLHLTTSRSLRLDLLRICTVCAALGAGWGCATPAQLKAVSYDVHVQLDPQTHALHGQTTVTLRAGPPARPGNGTATVELALNKALQVERIGSRGATVRLHEVHEAQRTQPADQPDTAGLLAIHRLVLERVARECTLTFDYSGELFQDVQAGEKRGQIHNFLMAAHVAPEGIYLDAGGGWYPFVYHDPAHPQGELAAYRLTVDPVADLRLVAGAVFDAQASQRSGKLVWRSKYNLDGLVLVGGPHLVKEKQVGPIHLALHYSLPADPESRAIMERNTDLFLEAGAGYLTRYPPLIGPYPYDDFTIVENFFSSGFAFPGFTLLNKVLLHMGQRALGHGYLDHEMLHGWWGNGIYVDPADGNWCEAITSFGANYYGYVLDGNEKGARDQRRGNCVAVSRLKPEEDLPLGTFGRPGGPSRDIGYSKGAMVFYMLAREIGQDNFWAAVRRLTAEHTGRYANWQTLQTLFEQQGRKELGWFFQQWVRTAGAPPLRLGSASWHSAQRMLTVEITQGEPAFVLSVPLSVVYEDGACDEELVRMSTPVFTAHLPAARPPASVVLDPDYEVLRKLPPQEIIPSSATTRAGRKLLIVKHEGEISKFYQRVLEDFSGEAGAKVVTLRSPGDLTTADLSQQSVLILGDAVRSPPVQALLARTNCPITWPAAGFRIDDTLYDKPGSAVLCTVHHPDLPEGGVTVYFGNSEGAVGRSDLLLFYRDSLVVFDTTSREVEGQTVYESRPIVRRDFETPQTSDVEKR